MHHKIAVIIACLVLVLLSGCAEDSPLDAPPLPSGIIHVSSLGADWSSGTARNPLASVEKAMELAIATGAGEVRIATGTYAGSFHLVGGIDLIGGLDPLTWEKEPGARSVLKYSGQSITGQDIQSPTNIHSLEFRSGVSFQGHHVAVALFCCGEDLHFSDCAFIIAKGEDGNPGQSQATQPPLPGFYVGGDGGPGSCNESIAAHGGEPFDHYYGSGGDGGWPNQPGSAGRNGSTHPDHPDCGYGGAASLPGMPGEHGQNGYDGDDGEHGVPPAIHWYFEGTNIELARPTDGNWGQSGGMGGGGSGGGGSDQGTGNGGGAAGWGGFRGYPGRGGHSGYHSIAMLCRDSFPRFSDCIFQTAGGGNGGTGGNGGNGISGSLGGMGGTECSPEVGAGGNGGNGGHGGHGGAGAGGNGGDSIGLLLSGNAAPVIEDNCSFVIGPPGEGGLGGQYGSGLSTAPSGWDGRSAEILVDQNPS